MQRGQLSDANNAIMSGRLSFAQAWGLDATGNWSQFWENNTGATWDLQQSRSASKANEIAGISGGGWAQPAYDAAGNSAQMPAGNTPTMADDARFDAWNRLMSISNGGSLIQENAYDGENRRVTTLVSGTTRHYYYSADWQDVEERLGAATNPDRQFVWGRRYVDQLVLRDRISERSYALQDPNWNVTAICSSSGTVLERYTFATYGQPTFLTTAFQVIGGSTYNWETLFAGFRWDTDTALHLARRRFLGSFLGILDTARAAWKRDCHQFVCLCAW
jgi:hypothetical protein